MATFVRIFTVATAAVLASVLCSPAWSAERLALVVGNGGYDPANIPRLDNPVSDARLMAKALESADFEVSLVTDADRDAMYEAIDGFGARLRSAGKNAVGLFYYAGHGVEAGGANYLIPLGADIDSERGFSRHAVSAQEVLSWMEGAGNRLNLVILDACRDNPYGGKRGGARGLGRMDAPSGSLIAYSAAPGETADDGDGANSPYTLALAETLVEPGLKVEDVFKRVRIRVEGETGDRQTPWEHSSLRGDFYFVPAAAVAVDDGDAERAFWDSIKNSRNPAKFGAYLDKYGEEGEFAALARIELAALKTGGGTETAEPGGAAPAVDANVPAEPAPEAREFSLGLERGDRRLIQRGLASLGFALGKADGLFGPRTRGAIRGYQEAKGFEATGYLSAEQAQTLVAMGAEAQAMAQAAAEAEMQAAAELAAKLEAQAPSPSPQPQPASPAPSRVTDPSTVVLESGLRLSDWVMLSEDRLEAGEHRALLVEGMKHIRAHGTHETVESVVERAVAGLVGSIEVKDKASARSALGAVERIRAVTGPRAELSGIEAAAHGRLGQFPQAVEAYRAWLGLAPAAHPERREMLLAMQRAERGERGPGVGERFRDCEECPELVVVPSGSFLMGSPSGEAGRDDDEGPVHRVTISKAFAVGVYEVTVGEFGRFVGETEHGKGGSCRTYEGGEWEEREGRSWRSPGFSQRDGQPVVCVSWEDAQSYVRWLSRETGAGYRLLSESEWEYVGRAGTETRYHWGDEIGRNRANCDGCGSRWDNSQTAPVGSFAANAFGLHDVSGNVWEWVEDCWNETYGGAPGDGEAWTRGDCSRRVLRGGSWSNVPRHARSANRNGSDTGGRDDFAGFRVARTLD